MDNTKIETLLRKWNSHFADVQKGDWVGTVPRSSYLKRMEKILPLRHIMVLTGVRRSGKSTIMHQLMQKLIEQGVPPMNVLYLYLEDVEVLPYISLGSQLLEKLYKYYLETYNPQGRVYVFIDELQGVKDFNHWLHTYYEFNRTNLKFVVSGSRRSLIQSEAATVLTGRTIQFDVYPLSFYEYLLLKNVEVQGEATLRSIEERNFSQTTSILHHLGNYLKEGGFPEIVLTTDEESKRLIANRYYQDILDRDIIHPNDIRNSRDIEVLGIRVMSDFTKTHTLRSLGLPSKLSVETVKTYLDYFYKAYLFFESPFFSYKIKVTQDIQKPRKIYVVDNGLRNFNTLTTRPDLGQTAENMVFMELIKNNIAVYYWKGKKEVDFVVQNTSLQLINISYTDEVPGRELESMVEGLKEFELEKGIVLTKNYSATQEVEGKAVEFVPLWAWLILNGKVFFGEQAKEEATK